VPDPYDGVAGNPYHRWNETLSLHSADAKLGRLVKGQLKGIQVIKHGVSPRILVAQVIGTKGRTQVSGDQLQQAFGLRTTYAAFTMISTNAGAPAPAATHGRRRGGAIKQAQQASAQAVLDLLPLVRDLISGAVPGLHGTISQARRGAKLTVQQQDSHGWHTVARSTVGAGGSYGLRLSGPGTYRVLYGGLVGPAVVVS
jgi:stage II sporulation protein D